MSEQQPEMTYNEALQELTRVVNMWRGVSRLEDALKKAANLEQSIRSLQRESNKLESEVAKTRATAQDAQQQMEAEISRATAEWATKLDKIREAGEHDMATATAHFNTQRERLQREMGELENTSGQRRQNLHDELVSLDKEIAEKQALVAELDAQMNTLRQRLG